MPVMPLVEVLGNIGALQREVGKENVGVIIGFTVRFNVAIESQFTAFSNVTEYVPADG